MDDIHIKINGNDEWMLMDDDGGLDGNHG